MIVKILDRLYVGDSSYTDLDLKQLRINYVVNVGGERTGLEDVHIHLVDGGGNRYTDIQGVIGTLHQKIYFDHRVLVHCRGGISRSPYIAVKYLEQIGFSLFDAIEYVKQRHPATQINQGLLHYVEVAK